MAAAERGEHAVLFAFDEGLGTIFARAEGFGIPLRPHVDAGRLEIRQIDPAEMSPGNLPPSCATQWKSRMRAW